MTFPLCFFKNPLPWISVLAPLLILAGFLDYRFLSILLLTSTVLIFSTLIITSSKQKARLEEKPVTDEILRLDQEISSPHTEEVISEELVRENEFIKQEKNAQEEDGSGQIDDYLVRSSPIILSESDCLGRSSTSEDSEADWQSQDNMFRSPDCSDGSISDEDSLIEISLPGGHYVGHNEEEPKFNLQKKLPDFSPGSFFKQHGLMELLAELNEMNEEENLIEIDISIGSIKCPRFEIEA